MEAESDSSGSIWPSVGYFILFMGVDMVLYSPAGRILYGVDAGALGVTLLAIMVALQPLLVGGIALAVVLAIFFVGAANRELGRARGKALPHVGAALLWTGLLQLLTFAHYFVDLQSPERHMLSFAVAGMAAAAGIGAANQIDPTRLGGPGGNDHDPTPLYMEHEQRGSPSRASPSPGAKQRGGGTLRQRKSVRRQF